MIDVKKRIVVLLGPPGAGKGTQAAYIKEKYAIPHISTGEILRENIKNGTTLGIEADKYMHKGELVPDEVVIEMIAARIDSTKDRAGFLFDGFPRTVAQTTALEKMLNDRNMKLDSMLVLEVEHAELVKRLVARADLSGRPDDKDPAVIENRIDVYKEKTEPIINYCRERGIYQPVNGMGSIEEIFERLSGYIKKLMS